MDFLSTRWYVLPPTTSAGKVAILNTQRSAIPGLGPMLGQAGHFRGAAEKIPYAIKRYEDETRRSSFFSFSCSGSSAVVLTPS